MLLILISILKYNSSIYTFCMRHDCMNVVKERDLDILVPKRKAVKILDFFDIFLLIFVTLNLKIECQPFAFAEIRSPTVHMNTCR